MAFRGLITVTFSYDRLLTCWDSMIQRCHNEKDTGYSDYGAKGIFVCDRWRNSFPEFAMWALSNGYQEHLTIDRINNSRSYNRKNCRWVTLKDQQNNRTNNVNIRVGTQNKTISQWSDVTGVPASTISQRYHGGIRGVGLFKESLGKTGLKNISYESRLYRVRFEKNGKKVYSKSFKTLSSAIKARDEYKKTMEKLC